MMGRGEQLESRQQPAGSSSRERDSREAEEELARLEIRAQEEYAEPPEAETEAEAEGEENVRVMVRCRPLSSGEKRASKEADLIKLFEPERCIELAGRQFQFDAVFGPKANNETVYMSSMRRLVESAFNGYNCTVFLYGQTGTGKTYTHSSLTLAAFGHLFSLIGASDDQARFLIRASYYELYNEDIHDLLAPAGKVSKPLELRESKLRGVYVRDLSNYLVNNLAELEKLKRLGDKQRTVAATKMNEHSSRSHSIFTITIEFTSGDADTKRPKAAASARAQSATKPKNRAQSAKAPKANQQQQQAVRVGRLHLIDLAGSERQSKSGSSGLQLKEASKINLSLTCLSLVIRALTDKDASHVPYRNSKLTRLLSGSLGGNSKTLLIACISPAPANLDETLNTLRFASRTKRIKNKARINEDAKDALLRKYRKQVEELRLKLKQQMQEKRGSSTTNSLNDDDDQAIDLLIAAEPNNNNKQQQQVYSEEDCNLLSQLRMLKGKIMVGGENLLEKAELHERLLEASRQEIEEKRAQEAKLKERLERKHKLIEKMAKSKGSLESQVVDLDERLKRVLLLYKRTKEEQRDCNGDHAELKESLLQTIRATSKEIKYADCIIDNFIPRGQLELINTYAQYDEDSDEWQVKYIALSGNNIAQTRRLAQAAQPEDHGSLLISSLGKAKHQPKTNSSKLMKENKKFNTTRTDPYIRLKSLIK